MCTTSETQNSGLQSIRLNCGSKGRRDKEQEVNTDCHGDMCLCFYPSYAERLDELVLLYFFRVSQYEGRVQVCVCYLCVLEFAPVAPADSDCPQKCHCHCAASLLQVMVSGSGCWCSCLLLVCSVCSCST